MSKALSNKRKRELQKTHRLMRTESEIEKKVVRRPTMTTLDTALLQ